MSQQTAGSQSRYNRFGVDFVGDRRTFTRTTRRQLAIQGASNSGARNQQNVGGTGGVGNDLGNEETNRMFQRTMERDYGTNSLVCILLQTKKNKTRVLKKKMRDKIDGERAKMKAHYPNHVVGVPKEISLDPYLIEIRAVPRIRVDNEEEEEEEEVSGIPNFAMLDEDDVAPSLHSRNTGTQVVTRIINLKDDESTNDVLYDTDSLVYPNLPTDPAVLTEVKEEEKRYGTLNSDVFQSDEFKERYDDFPYLSLFELFFGSVNRKVHDNQEEEDEGEGEGQVEEMIDEGEDENDNDNDNDNEEEEEDEEMEEKPPGEKLIEHLWQDTNLYAHFRVIYEADLKRIARYHSHVRVTRRKKDFEKRNETITNYCEIDDEALEDMATPANNPDLDSVLLEDGEDRDNNDADRSDSSQPQQPQPQQQFEEEQEEEKDEFAHYILSERRAERYKKLAKTLKFRKWADAWKESHSEERIPHEYYTKEKIQRYIICVMLIGLERGDVSCDRIWSSQKPSDLIFSLMSRDEYNEITRNFHYSYCKLRDWMEVSMPMFYTPGCYLSIDESICGFYGRAVTVKIGCKPKSKGIKSLSLNDSKGFAMKFVVYWGGDNENDDEYDRAKKDFDHSGEGVVRRLLINTVSGQKEHYIGDESILFADRWFGSLNTLDTISMLKIPAVVTVNKKSKRGRDVFVALEAETKDKKCVQLSCAPVSNQDYLFTSYNDSSLCRILSYRVSDVLVLKKSKYNVKKKLPLVSALYNDGMLGTDQMNGYLYRFQNERRFRRHTMKLAYFFLAMLNTNLYLIHKTKERDDRDSLYWFLFNLGQEYVQHVCDQERPNDHPQNSGCIQAHGHYQVHHNQDGGYCSLCGTYVAPKRVMATCTHVRCRNVLRNRFCLRKNCHRMYHGLGYHLY